MIETQESGLPEEAGALLRRVQAAGSISSYSVVLLSEGTENKMFAEGESEYVENVFGFQS